jgi:hypothetical protein
MIEKNFFFSFRINKNFQNIFFLIIIFIFSRSIIIHHLLQIFLILLRKLSIIKTSNLVIIIFMNNDDSIGSNIFSSIYNKISLARAFPDFQRIGSTLKYNSILKLRILPLNISHSNFNIISHINAITNNLSIKFTYAPRKSLPCSSSQSLLSNSFNSSFSI